VIVNMHGRTTIKKNYKNNVSFTITFGKIFIRFFLKIFIRQFRTLKISCYGLAHVSDSCSSQIGKSIFRRIGAKTCVRAFPWFLGIPHNSN
jgi:cellulose synthase/poly-beta-1,6-N-acetylglucosamine synthase-like glycosyltransferase